MAPSEGNVETSGTSGVSAKAATVLKAEPKDNSSSPAYGSAPAGHDIPNPVDAFMMFGASD